MFDGILDGVKCVGDRFRDIEVMESHSIQTKRLVGEGRCWRGDSFRWWGGRFFAMLQVGFCNALLNNGGLESRATNPALTDMVGLVADLTVLF